MTIDTIMTTTLVTVSLDESVQHVREIFNHSRFHHLVVTEREKAVGVITDRDLLANLSPFVGKPSERTQDHFLLTRKAHQIMERQFVFVERSTEIKVAQALMLHKGASCVLVLDAAHKAVGIVTWHDFLRYSLDCGIEPGCTINPSKAA